MRRRTLLRRTGALAAVGLAGCVSDEQNDNESNDDNDTGDDEQASQPNGTDATPSMTIGETAIETLSSDCNSGSDGSARVEITDGTVTVTGTMTTSDPCHEAKLQNVNKLSGSSEDGGEQLQVDVVSASTSEACVDCVGAVEYEATIEFDGGAPEDVRVTHDGDSVSLVNEEESGSGSGSDPAARSIQNSSLSVTNRESGQQVNEVQIGFDTDAETVGLTGTIWGSDGCQTAILDDASYDADQDHLQVSVVTESEDPDKMCTQAIVEIDYEAAVTFSGGLPGSVSVSHDGSDIATAAHGSSSASATPSDDS